jgi:signal-transduction protein with cAMP-binding, CBS, and nucleotidyltransferase domain
MEADMWDNLISDMLLDEPEAAHILQDSHTVVRPWPPIMIRDFLRTSETKCHHVSEDFTVGHVAEFLSDNRGACIAVYNHNDELMGIAVDDDAMALIKRDGMSALDTSVVDCVQRQRPVCSLTDSPYVVLGLMKDQNWDRVGVSEHGRVIGVIHRRDLVRFCDD